MRANLAAPGRQRGMALLVVLLILSVMVIIASNMSGRLQLELRRTANITTGKQAWWYALSAEALVSKVLTQDFKDNPEVVNLSQNWARKNTVFPVDDGQLKGEVTDLQSCFNLNSLSVASKAGSGEELEQQPYPVQVFRELLKQLAMDDYEAAQQAAANGGLSQQVDAYERALIAAELARPHNSLRSLAEALGLPRKTLHDKLRKHGLSLAAADLGDSD